MARPEVFNTRRTRLMRRQVPRAENVCTVVIVLVLVAIVAWVTGTRDKFDAGERDLPIELLYNDRPEIEIYTRPLKPWVEPGSATMAARYDFGAFPEGVVDDRWQPAGRVRQFGADNLYEKINGEAEKFIKQGFVSLDYLALRDNRDGIELALELFDQGDLGGSLGVFAEHASGRAVESRHGVTFFTTTAGVIGRIDRYFFRVAGDRESEVVSQKSADLIGVFSNLGSSVAQPALREIPEGFAILKSRLNLEEADIQFQESNVFQYDFASRFWFGNVGTDGKARLFVHIADDASEAGELLAALVEEQSYEYTTESNDDDWVLFRHQFQPTYFAVGQRGRYVYGGEKLPGVEDAESMMRRLDSVLDDG